METADRDRDGKARWARALQQAKPDPALAARLAREEAASRMRRAAFARQVGVEETRSLCRRAERAQGEQERVEVRALIAAAEQRLEARDTVQGQLIAAFRRGR